MRRYVLPVTITFAAIFLVLISVILILSPVAPKARAVLSRDRATIGEKVTYSIRAVYGQDIGLEIPDIDDKFADFDIIDKGSLRKKSFGRSHYTKWYIIANYRPGLYVIPGIPVKYTDDNGAEKIIDVNPVTLTIKGVETGMKEKPDQSVGISEEGPFSKDASAGPAGRRLKNTDMPIQFRIIDAEKPLNVITYSDVITILIVVISSFLIMVFIFHIINKISRKISPELTPYEAALKQLEGLRNSADDMEGGARILYFSLASILRGYIKAVFNTGSAELTTKEYILQVDKLEKLQPDLKDAIKKILMLADLVKYSGYRPENDESASSIELAKSIIKEINDIKEADKERA